MSDSNLLERLYEADRQGQRAISTLWPGDQFIYRGETHTVSRLQWHNRTQIFIFTTISHGGGVLVSTLDGTEEIRDEGRTFLFDAMLLFPSFISDEHAEAEQGMNV